MNAVHKTSTADLALLLLLATLWGASYTLIKLGVATIPPLTLIAARTLVAGLLLLIVMRWRGLAFPMDAANWRRFMVQACLNSVIPFTLIAWAEQSLGAGLATILSSTSPIFAFLLTFAGTRREPTTRRKLFGVVAGLAEDHFDARAISSRASAERCATRKGRSRRGVPYHISSAAGRAVSERRIRRAR